MNNFDDFTHSHQDGFCDFDFYEVDTHISVSDNDGLPHIELDAHDGDHPMSGYYGC